jgi:hypothetical protein
VKESVPYVNLKHCNKLFRLVKIFATTIMVLMVPIHHLYNNILNCSLKFRALNYLIHQLGGDFYKMSNWVGSISHFNEKIFPPDAPIIGPDLPVS